MPPPVSRLAPQAGDQVKPATAADWDYDPLPIGFDAPESDNKYHWERSAPPWPALKTPAVPMVSMPATVFYRGISEVRADAFWTGLIVGTAGGSVLICFAAALFR